VASRSPQLVDEAKHYELAKRHVAEAEARIIRQREIIERLTAAGHDAGAAHNLLETMEASLKIMRVHLRQIESEMARGTHPSPPNAVAIGPTIMARTFNRLKQRAEKRFTLKVDVPVPRAGLGQHLTEMLAWCREHAARGRWDCHGHQARAPDGTLQKFARFYFGDEPIAKAFRKRWL